MIPEQSFDVTLDDWGEVTFVSCWLSSWGFEASFYLIREEQILYRFPYMCEDNKRSYTGCFDSIEAVAFRDINDDGKKDIMTDVEQHILGKDMTIENICNYLKDNN